MSYSNPSNRQSFECDFDGCGKTFDRKARLERHKNGSHLNLRNYKCTQCDDAYSRKDHLKRHFESKHMGTKCTPRPGCEEDSANMWTSLPEEVLEEAKKLDIKKENLNPFKCTEVECTERFSTKQRLEKHEKSHKLKCRICKAKFKKSESYETHMKFHDGEQVPCPYKDRNKCVSTFYDEKIYGLHVRKCKAQYKLDLAKAKEAKENKPASESSPTPSAGSEGGKEAKDQAKEGKKPVRRKTSDSIIVPKHKFPCVVPRCGKSYTSKYNLQHHVRAVHENERPHKCPCGASFATKHVLFTHKQRHKENGQFDYNKPLRTPLKLGGKRPRPESDENSIVPQEGPKKRRVKNPPLIYTSRRKSRNPEVEARKGSWCAARISI